VAAARLSAPNGTSPRFVTQFGNDAHAQWLESALADEGLDLSACGRADGHPSGQGIVLLEADGSVTSVVVSGANAAWPTGEYAQLVADAGVLMLQREVPEHVNLAVAEAAAAAGVPVLLDIGGEDRPLSENMARLVDFLCPNEGELGRLTGLPTGSEAEVLAAAAALQAEGARHVLVTLGERGSLALLSNGTVLRQSAFAIPGGGGVVDATGAGDAFRAGFAVGLLEGRPLAECLRLGSAAGAIAASRAGAVPSLPWRDEAHAMLEGQPLPASSFGRGSCSLGQCFAAPPGSPQPHGLRFASRLNSMKARDDLWNGAPLDLEGLIARQGTVPGLDGVFFNYLQHLAGQSPSDVAAALAAAGLSAAAVCMRFPDAMRAGALTAPSAATRARAVALAAEACQWARDLGAPELVIWPQTDGYDYNLQVNYTTMWTDAVEAYRAVCNACRDLKVSIEFKPTDEVTRFAAVPSTGAALLLAQDVGAPNFGLTLDVGHMLMAGENPAQSLEMAARRGKLFGVQLGDGHSRLGAEDGLAFGSVHAAAALEVVLWLQRARYSGYIYFDTFPRNEDPVEEAAYNVRTFRRLWSRAERLSAAGVDALLAEHDAMGVLRLLEDM